MSMSDCEKCWDTPCCCGWNYKKWSDEIFDKFIKDIVEGRRKHIKEEQAKINLNGISIH